MSLLTPIQVGPMLLPNRFMRSATNELTAKSGNAPTESQDKIYSKLAKGKVGLIVPGYLFVGRGSKRNNSLNTIDKANKWKKTIDSVHKEGSKIMLQIYHDGEINGVRYLPSRVFPFYSALTIPQIEEIIDDFIKAGVYAYKAGADGVQLHAAHGFLLSMFLSPFTNRRNDKYSGSPEARVRIIKEIVDGIKKATSDSFSIGIKLNGSDNLGIFGVRSKLCSKYVNLLNGIDLFEISCGFLNPFSTIRAKPPKYNLTGVFRKIINPWGFHEAYNQKNAEYIKKKNPDKIIASVGGYRTFKSMEDEIKNHKFDIVSISRPFVRQPNLVLQYQKGLIKQVDCKSCNQCFYNLYTHPEKDIIKCTYP